MGRMDRLCELRNKNAMLDQHGLVSRENASARCALAVKAASCRQTRASRSAHQIALAGINPPSSVVQSIVRNPPRGFQLGKPPGVCCVYLTIVGSSPPLMRL